jgi:hypothetical protein
MAWLERVNASNSLSVNLTFDFRQKTLGACPQGLLFLIHRVFLRGKAIQRLILMVEVADKWLLR